MLDTLRDWADCNTGSDNRAGLEKLAAQITDHASFLPTSPTTLLDPTDRRPCALLWRYTPGPDLPSILFNGHLDTVFAADHPFQTCRIDAQGDRIHGPGVADMKGGLVILFATLRAFLQSELRDQIAWEILLTFDEETGSAQNVGHLQAAAARHDFGITFESSPHPTELIRNRMGTGRVEITCQGQAAHAGRNFSTGRNAILALGRYLHRIDLINTDLTGSIVNIGSIAGGGPVNVVPDFASAAVNVRATTPSIQTDLMARLHEIARQTTTETGCAIVLRGGFTRPPKVADAATDHLLAAWRQVGASIGLKISWRDTGGASDGNILQAAGLPNIDNLGAVGSHLHSDAEYAEISSLVARTQLNTCFLLNLAGGQLDRAEGRFIDLMRGQRKALS